MPAVILLSSVSMACVDFDFECGRLCFGRVFTEYHFWKVPYSCLDERSSSAPLMDFFNDELPVFVTFCFLAVRGGLCHHGSDKLSSPSHDPCLLDVSSSFLPRGSKVLTSSGMNPPLKLRASSCSFFALRVCY